MTIIARTLAVLFALAAAQPALAGETLDAIRARGTLRVGTTGDYKPFTFRNADGSYRGADIRMAERLAQAMGVKLEIVPTVWGSMMEDFKARKFDVAMGGVTVIPPRQQAGLFTPTTYVDGKRPVVRCADKDRLNSVAAIDQPSVRVVVNPGAANEQFARANFTHAKLTVHPDNATVFDEIVASRQDVMVTDGIEVDHQAHLHPELCPASVAQPFTRLEKAYWMQPDKELGAAVDAWLDREIKSGEWTRLLDAAQAEP